MEILTKSEKETQEFAKDYAKSLKFGDILALSGDLGSGKTAFTKGVALGLGVEDVITSPTFVVIKEYPLKKFQISKSPTSARASAETGKLQINSKSQNTKLIHIDCYRIADVKDAESIGLREYMDTEDNIIIIEWAENIKSILPQRTKSIIFKHLGKDKRKIVLT